jgi:hypothetical protein
MIRRFCAKRSRADVQNPRPASGAAFVKKLFLTNCVPPESRVVVKQFPSRHPLPLPVGEVAERSEAGEGK